MKTKKLDALLDELEARESGEWAPPEAPQIFDATQDFIAIEGDLAALQIDVGAALTIAYEALAGIAYKSGIALEHRVRIIAENRELIAETAEIIAQTEIAISTAPLADLATRIHYPLSRSTIAEIIEMRDQIIAAIDTMIIDRYHEICAAGRPEDRRKAAVDGAILAISTERYATAARFIALVPGDDHEMMRAYLSRRWPMDIETLIAMLERRATPIESLLPAAA